MSTQPSNFQIPALYLTPGVFSEAQEASEPGPIDVESSLTHSTQITGLGVAMKKAHPEAYKAYLNAREQLETLQRQLNTKTKITVTRSYRTITETHTSVSEDQLSTAKKNLSEAASTLFNLRKTDLARRDNFFRAFFGGATTFPSLLREKLEKGFDQRQTKYKLFTEKSISIIRKNYESHKDLIKDVKKIYKTFKRFDFSFQNSKLDILKDIFIRVAAVNRVLLKNYYAKKDSRLECISDRGTAMNILKHFSQDLQRKGILEKILEFFTSIFYAREKSPKVGEGIIDFSILENNNN